MTTSTLLPIVHLGIRANQPKAISPDLFGIFFEDLNYAADGGLYAELIQNRSFEYQATEQPAWNNLTAWQLVTRGEGHGSFRVSTVGAIHPNNPHFGVLEVREPGGGVGVMNAGFGGIPVQAGAKYDLSLFARLLFVGNRWAPHEEVEAMQDELESQSPDGEDTHTWAQHEADQPTPVSRNRSLGEITVRLESEDGEVLAEAQLPSPGTAWTRLSVTLTACRTEGNARFVLLQHAPGGLAIDVVSLFPQQTFRNRANGLREDLAQIVADLKPRFVRFPGGCLVHGNGLGNMYRWKDSIGPIEQRREQPNLWGYHQTVGLGYYEYFQYCEDIGAKPLPVVPSGVCCQNSGYVTGGHGQEGLPLEEMPAYIQEILDLIEWANGPADSFWGAKRAEAGHPEPFGLEYLGVGNEEHITPVFRERFELIYEVLQEKHPEITVIGTVGPFHSGKDYDEGWKISNELQLEMVDEHYYEKPEWFWENLERYDTYNRQAAAVYVGEYAAHEKDRKNTLRSALSEAAAMTGFERNGDVVRLVSYAPLLAKRGHTQWAPDLIYFDNTRVFPSVNYYVQQLFGVNSGDVAFPIDFGAAGGNENIAASCVQDSARGDIVLKIVSRSAEPVKLELDISGFKNLGSEAECIVLSGDELAENAFGEAPTVLPQTSTVPVGPQFFHEVPPHSLTVLRFKSTAA